MAVSHKEVHGMVELHEDDEVDGKAGSSVVRGGIHGQPGEGVVRLQYIPTTNKTQNKG